MKDFEVGKAFLAVSTEKHKNSLFEPLMTNTGLVQSNQNLTPLQFELIGGLFFKESLEKVETTLSARSVGWSGAHLYAQSL